MSTPKNVADIAFGYTRRPGMQAGSTRWVCETFHRATPTGSRGKYVLFAIRAIELFRTWGPHISNATPLRPWAPVSHAGATTRNATPYLSYDTGGVATTLPVPGKLWPLKSAFTDSRLKTIKEKIPNTIPGIPPITKVTIARIKQNQYPP